MKLLRIEAVPGVGEPPFLAAQRAAIIAATASSGEVMLLAWKDNLTGNVSPDVAACGPCGLEGWELYAQSRGGDVRVEVHGGDYVFIFLTL